MSLICSICTSPTLPRICNCTGRSGVGRGKQGCEIRQLSQAGMAAGTTAGRHRELLAAPCSQRTLPHPPPAGQAGSAAIPATAQFCTPFCPSASLLPVHVPDLLPGEGGLSPTAARTASRREGHPAAGRDRLLLLSVLLKCCFLTADRNHNSTET